MQFRSSTEHRPSQRTSSIISRGRTLLMGDALSRQRTQQTSSARSAAATVSKDSVATGALVTSSRPYTFSIGSVRREARYGVRPAATITQGNAATVPSVSKGGGPEAPVSSRTRFGGSQRLSNLPTVRAAKSSPSFHTSSFTRGSPSLMSAGRSAAGIGASSARDEITKKEIASTDRSDNGASSAANSRHLDGNSLTLSVSKRPAAQQKELFDSPPFR